MTKCPYCGKKISYFTLMCEKKKGEHFCDQCHKESKICISKNIVMFYICTVVLALIITALLIALKSYDENIVSCLYVAIPFVIFWLISPVFIIIKPYKKYREWVENNQK